MRVSSTDIIAPALSNSPTRGLKLDQWDNLMCFFGDMQNDNMFAADFSHLF